MPNFKPILNKPIKLLPQYFKKVGLGIIILCVLVPLAFKLLHIQTAPAKKEMIKHLAKDIFMIGLMFIAFSRDKIEDELTMLLRMKALISGVMFTFIYIVVADVFNLFVSEPIIVDNAFKIMTQCVVMQISYYQLAKLNRWP